MMFEIQTLQVVAEGASTLRVMESRERYVELLVDLTREPTFALAGQTIKTNTARLVVLTYMRLGKSFCIEANGVLYALEPEQRWRPYKGDLVRVAAQVFVPRLSEHIKPPPPLPSRLFVIPKKFLVPDLRILSAATCEFHADPRYE
jgi:hypothetical protein